MVASHSFVKKGCYFPTFFIIDYAINQLPYIFQLYFLMVLSSLVRGAFKDPWGTFY